MKEALVSLRGDDLPPGIRVRSARIEEGISRLPTADLVVHLSAPLDDAELLGKPVTIVMRVGAGRRTIRGRIWSVQEAECLHGVRVYHVQVTSALAQLDFHVSSTIHVGRTPAEVLGDTLRPEVPKDVTVGFCVEHATRPMDLCVRYRESSLDFIRRVAAHHGVWWLVSTVGAKEHLRFGDANHLFSTLRSDAPDGAFAVYGAHDAEYLSSPSVRSLTRRASLAPSRVTVTDWDATRPGANLTRLREREGSDPMEAVVLFGEANLTTPSRDHPGRVDNGDLLARVRLEALNMERVRYEGRSNVVGLAPGRRVSCGSGRAMATLVVTHTTTYYQAAEEALVAGEVAFEGRPRFESSFVGIPAETPVRMPALPRPRAPALVGAVVVGAAEDEPGTDVLGRVSLVYDFDGRQVPSRPVPVAHAAFAGRGYGLHLRPRAGQHVLVAFEHGEFERPVVVGAQHTALALPGIELPEERTVSGLVTRTIGGTTSNFFLINDMPGAEYVHTHSTGDHRVSVVRDETHRVGGDRDDRVRGDEDRHVSGNARVRVEKDAHQEVVGSVCTVCRGAMSVDVGGAVTITANRFEVRVGESMLVLTPQGVEIHGFVIELHGRHLLDLRGGLTVINENPPAGKPVFERSFRVTNRAGRPAAGRRYRIHKPDGATVEGTTDAEGMTMAVVWHEAGTVRLEVFDDMDMEEDA